MGYTLLERLERVRYFVCWGILEKKFSICPCPVFCKANKENMLIGMFEYIRTQSS